VLTGEAWEPGRAICFRVNVTAWESHPMRRTPGDVESVRSTDEPATGHEDRTQTRYRRTRGRTEGRRDELMAVLAEHSTEGRSSRESCPTVKVGKCDPSDPLEER
jgi:hypothetical protein